MNDVFQQFLALVDRDNQYKELTNQLKNQNLLIENLKKQKTQISSSFLNTKILLDNAQKDLKDLEHELNVFAQRENSIKKAIEQTVSNKDVKILQKEIISLAQPREKAEESLMEALNRLENVTRNYNENEAKLNLLNIDIDLKIKEALDEYLKLETKFLAYQKEEVIMSENIPENWLELYKRTRSFITDPVSKLIGNCCEICGFTMTTHEVMTLKKMRVMQCSECYRVIYYKP